MTFTDEFRPCDCDRPTCRLCDLFRDPGPKGRHYRALWDRLKVTPNSDPHRPFLVTLDRTRIVLAHDPADGTWRSRDGMWRLRREDNGYVLTSNSAGPRVVYRNHFDDNSPVLFLVEGDVGPLPAAAWLSAA